MRLELMKYFMLSQRLDRCPLGLLGMLFLLAAVEGFLSRNAIDYTPDTTWDWNQAGRVAHRRVQNCEILILGDSQAKLGLVPQLIEMKTHRKAHNLAVAAGQVPTSYFLLSRAIDAGARPEAIVIDFLPHFLTVDPWFTIRHWPEFATGLECLELSWNARDPDFFAAIILGRLLPSVRARHDIRSNILAALNGETASPRSYIPALWRNWRQNQGAQLTPRKPEFSGEIDPNNEAAFPESWACHFVNQLYLKKIFDLAASNDIKVFWFLPPSIPAIDSRREELGLAAQFDLFVRDWQDQYPNIVVLDGRRSAYEAHVFSDPLHIDRHGAVLLSTDVALILRRHLDSPKMNLTWQPLPPFREQWTEFALEDTMDSLDVVRKNLKARKR